MNASEHRQAFRVFAGEAQYRKFVRAINRASRSKGRLLFWQEKLWDKFIAEVPDATRSQKEILTYFSVCEVHDQSLQAPPIDEHDPELLDDDVVERAWMSLFPNAVSNKFVCACCRTELDRWVLANPDYVLNRS